MNKSVEFQIKTLRLLDKLLKDGLLPENPVLIITSQKELDNIHDALADAEVFSCFSASKTHYSEVLNHAYFITNETEKPATIPAVQ